MNAKPTGKPNLLKQQVLSELIDTKTVSWQRKKIDPDSGDPAKPGVTEARVHGSSLTSSLARNVSELNVERAAREWMV